MPVPCRDGGKPLRGVDLLRVIGLLLCVAAMMAAAQQAVAGAPQHRPEVWDIRLGAAVAELDGAAYQGYACGTNGGPPSLALTDWTEFQRCPADGSGLREVTFIYDDELEYRARALELESWIERYEGTRVFGHHVIPSVLIDEGGHVRAIRIVTDNRVPVRERTAAYQLRYNFKARFGLDGWTCVNGEPDDRRQPVGRDFVDERCRRDVGDDIVAISEARFYRKAGQEAFDPATRRLTPGQFESSARLELYQRAFAPPES